MALLLTLVNREFVFKRPLTASECNGKQNKFNRRKFGENNILGVKIYLVIPTSQVPFFLF